MPDNAALFAVNRAPSRVCRPCPLHRAVLPSLVHPPLSEPFALNVAAPPPPAPAAPGPCRICGAALQAERQLFDDRYGYPDRYGLYRCAGCGHRALNLQMTPAQVSELYTRFYPRSSFDVEAWQPPREEPAWRTWWQGLRASAFRWVPPGVKVLDVGCGFGESLGYHRNRGCQVQGVEADANILRVAERHGLDVKVGLFDAANYAPASFDVVTLDQVIEHVADPLVVLRGVCQVLKPGGMLVLSTPNANGLGAWLFGRLWIHWHTPYHVQFFSTASMRQALGQAGLHVESVRTVTNSAWLGFQWCHLVAPGGPGVPSAFWSTQMPRNTGQKLLLGLAAVAGRLGLNALLTRLADALGRGDNFVFVIRKTTP